jgi:hypothetical protein
LLLDACSENPIDAVGALRLVIPMNVRAV